MFRLNPAIDRPLLAARLAAEGRVQIGDLLDDESAALLFDDLRARTDWKQVVNSGDKVFDLDRKTRAEMTPAQADALDQAVFAGARSGFQHRYEAIRVPDGAAERRRSNDLLARFAAWLSSGEALDLLRQVTDKPAIDFADAQATALGPGGLAHRA